ncbi:MAG: PAS domain-containing protein [Caulobacteraceae bacterium]|nr:PAS domain-containing protein [Caulobacteraceae bacterium]
MALKELAKSGDLGADLAAAFDASPNPYMLLTPELRYAGMNRAYLEVTQQTREALIGRYVMDAFDGDGDDHNARRLLGSFQKVLATNEIDHLPVLHYAIPVPDGQGGSHYVDRYWSCTHSPIIDAEGKLRFILQHTTDITELQLLRRQAREGGGAESALDAIVGGGLMARAQRVQEDNRRLEVERSRLIDMFMQAPGFVAVLNGPDHVFEMVNPAYAQLVGHRAVTGQAIRDALPELLGQGYFELLDDVYATGEPFEGRESQVQLQHTPNGPLTTVWLNFIYQPIRDADGRITGIFVQGHEVTDSVRAAQRQKLMIDELNHRVKNTLATVQSIAMQTARSHDDPKTFAESFQSRLMALSHTHDLLTRSHWEGADLAEILRHETEAHDPLRLVANGPPVALSPAAALSLGMIFHELATNAAKYGALSDASGRVFIDWSVADQTDRRLTIEWRELDGPPVAAPTRRGFGSRLIERNVRHDLGGEAELSYAADGFRAAITLPLDRGHDQ